MYGRAVGVLLLAQQLGYRLFAQQLDIRLFAQQLGVRLPAQLLGVLLCAQLLGACGQTLPEANAATGDLEYRLDYRVSLRNDDPTAAVELVLRQPGHLLREVRFDIDPNRFSKLTADGELSIDRNVVRWLPPAAGGTLHWDVLVPRLRGDAAYDAWIGDRWGLFRAEDLIPRAATRTLKGAYSNTTLRFELPPGWSVVTPYRELDGHFPVVNDNRRYDEPAGWIAVGELGVRRDTIAGARVVIAAPKGSKARRMDMLAMLNWTLPELARLVPRMPERLTVVSAGEPMWRGGLSGPASLYLHADRPLISENGTSTLLHEIVHTVMPMQSGDGYDWIVEGLAEYYSIELLRRSGTLSARRQELAVAAQRDWGRESSALCGAESAGSTTARAVTVFVELDREIRHVSAGAANLDDVVARLLESRSRVDLAALADASAAVMGEKSETLNIDRLPGCRNITPNS